LPETKSTLLDIFSKPPDFIDEQLFAYKVPEPDSSSPFIVLGDGWSGLKKKSFRYIEEYSEIIIINPTNEIIYVTMEIQFKPTVENELTLLLNRNEISNISVAKNSPNIVTPPLELNPNENHLTILQARTTVDPASGAIKPFNPDYISKNIRLEVHKISIKTEFN